MPTYIFLNFSVNLPCYLADCDKQCVVINTTYGLFLHTIGCAYSCQHEMTRPEVPGGEDGLHVPSKQLQKTREDTVTQEQIAVVASLFS
jgi:hypothetical protein